MYSIYHIPTFVHKDGSIGKIGCTHQEPKVRVEKQGYSSFEILETHDCIDRASNREQELQEQYGYPIDRIPYKESVRRRPKWKKEWADKGRETMKKNGFYKEFYKTGIEKRRRAILQYTKDGTFVGEHKSLTDALKSIGRLNGNGTSAISGVCRGKRKSMYGYVWKYKD